MSKDYTKSLTKFSKIHRELSKFLNRKNWLPNYQSSQVVNHFRSQVLRALQSSMETITDQSIKRAVQDTQKLNQSEVARVRKVIEEDYGSFSNFLSSNDLTDSLVNFYNDANNQMLDKLDIPATFDLKDPAVINRLSDRSTFLIKSVDDTTLDDISTRIVAGMENDMSWQQIAADIHQNNPDIADYRSQLIARMESANAANQAQLEFAKKNNFEKKQVILSPNHDIDDECNQAVEDGAINVDDEFSTGDDAPPFHINCQCEASYLPPDDWDSSDVWLGE